MRSSRRTEVSSVILTVINRLVTRTLKNSVFQTAIAKAVQIFLATKCSERSGGRYGAGPRIFFSCSRIDKAGG